MLDAATIARRAAVANERSVALLEQKLQRKASVQDNQSCRAW
jgi:hypothetical protein